MGDRSETNDSHKILMQLLLFIIIINWIFLGMKNHGTCVLKVMRAAV